VSIFVKEGIWKGASLVNGSILGDDVGTLPFLGASREHSRARDLRTRSASLPIDVPPGGAELLSSLSAVSRNAGLHL
jgi:hypothetical protein